jgi:hypothetical protein
MKDLLPKYFSSAWSFAQFKVAADCRCICAFVGGRDMVIGKTADVALDQPLCVLLYIEVSHSLTLAYCNVDSSDLCRR